MGIEQYANDAATSLASTLNSGATSISLTNGSAFPTGPHRIRIENEIILIASRSSNTLTVASGGRGSEGTSDVQHASSTTVEHVLTRRGLFQAPGVHDVRAYGAVGNGTTDDSTAIQAAIAAAVADGGGQVYIPAGVWYLGTTGLQITGNRVHIRGAGRMATQLLYAGTTGAAISNSNTSTTRHQTMVENMWIYSETLTTGALILLQNFYQFHGFNLVLQCSEGPGGSALHVNSQIAWSTYFSFWDHCQFTGKDYAILCDGAGTANGHHFSNFEINGNTATGIYISSTVDTNGGWRILNGSIEGCGGAGGAIYFADSAGGGPARNNIINGVNIENCTSSVYLGQNAIFNNIMALTVDGTSGIPTFYSDYERNNNIYSFGELSDDPPLLSTSINGGYNRQAALRLPLNATAFTTAIEDGRIYYDVATHRIYVYDGAGWRYVATT